MIGFIVNPASGNGRGRKVWRQISKILDGRCVPHAVRFTTRQGEAPVFAQEWASDDRVTIIAAVGGDGTVHETVNGLYTVRSLKPFGYIPAGSGNDFARGHRIPLDPVQALELLLGTHVIHLIDAFRMNGRMAINSIGAGFDGRVALLTNQASYKKWLNVFKLGKLAYVLSLVRVLLSYKTCSAVIIIDGVGHSLANVWFIAAANIAYYGGGMQICPQANPRDGLAEICVVGSINRFELLRVFPRVYRGTHVGHRAVTLLQGSRIEIHAPHSLDIHMDGETAGTTPIALEVIPSALSIISPS